jgi:hypothetical protein
MMTRLQRGPQREHESPRSESSKVQLPEDSVCQDARTELIPARVRGSINLPVIEIMYSTDYHLFPCSYNIKPFRYIVDRERPNKQDIFIRKSKNSD